MFRIANDAGFWDRIARKYAADPVADVAGYERTLERTRHFLRGDDQAFEFGCGTGTTALKLAPSVGRIVATDISGEMVVIAREKAEAKGGTNVVFEVATPDAAPWPDGTFDVALGFNVLHLVAARNAALRGVHRLLKPGGLFISKTPCLKEMNPMVCVAVPVMQLFGKAPYLVFFPRKSWSARSWRQGSTSWSAPVMPRAAGTRGRSSWQRSGEGSGLQRRRLGWAVRAEEIVFRRRFGAPLRVHAAVTSMASWSFAWSRNCRL